jgi:putative flippase GtrA
MAVELIRTARSAILSLHPAFQTEAFAQLVRFVIGGFGVTLFAVGVYSLAAAVLHIAPLAANLVSWLCGVTVSYLVHSRWSFAAETGEGEGRTILRFLMVAIFAFLLNSFWVWLTTGLFHLHPLAPVPAMMFLTPLVSFLLNRYWVFEVA